MAKILYSAFIGRAVKTGRARSTEVYPRMVVAGYSPFACDLLHVVPEVLQEYSKGRFVSIMDDAGQGTPNCGKDHHSSEEDIQACGTRFDVT